MINYIRRLWPIDNESMSMNYDVTNIGTDSNMM